LFYVIGGDEVNNSKRHWIVVLGALFLLMLVSGCKKPPKPPPPPPAKAPTATLSANPASIQSGQSATLTWSTEDATDVALDGQKVDPSGSQTVSPTQTTTYHLTAKGAGGTQEATAQVTVSAPPPPPTPTPAPTPPPVTDDQLFAQNITDVYFDYDKADLRPDGAQMLARAAQMIKAKGWKVQIEGNADERGSTEYNLALGERRADAAKQALISAGVGADSLKTISYGKEKPQCTESNEECWQKNRRDHFTLLH
jgi:peptidoglycan-associated lipoprotein